MSLSGRIITVYGNMVTAEVEGAIRQNAVAYCHRIRVLLVFESSLPGYARRHDLAAHLDLVPAARRANYDTLRQLVGGGSGTC